MSLDSLFLYSEPHSPTGNVTSEGILNQLGRPKLDLFTIMVREAVQNSWDARADEYISFGIDIWRADQTQRDILQLLFAHTPPGLPLIPAIRGDEDLWLMSIFDRGTVGLGGPTRADEGTDEGESYDFVDFLRNVGQPPDKKLAGGTYGYGKAAFYRASRTRTILTHTRCKWKGALEERFIAAALGDPYQEQGKRFTGRHWWGQFEDGIAEPLIGQHACQLAHLLGLPSFSDGQRGTTVTIIQPSFEDSPRESLDAIKEALLWYFWPKMLRKDMGTPSIKFELFWEHEPQGVPSPQDYPPLDLFAQAAASHTQAGNDESPFSQIAEISSSRPKKLLGQLALAGGLANQRHYSNSSAAPIPVGERCHHVALMRQPELVVRYFPCQPHPVDAWEYAGVFITDEEVDRVFADSEPPTHDDWVVTRLEERHHKVFINVALREIAEKASQFVYPKSTVSASSDQALSLGGFANVLGSLLTGSHSPLLRDGRASSPRVSGDRQERLDLPQVSSDRGLSGLTIDNPQGVDEAGRILVGAAATVGPTGSPWPLNFVPGVEDQPKIGRYRAPESMSAQLRVSLRPETELAILDDGTPVAVFRIDVLAFGLPARSRIRAYTRAILDDGTFEEDPPQAAKVPSIRYWQSNLGEWLENKSYVDMDETCTGTWCIVVELIEDAPIGLDIRSEPLE